MTVAARSGETENAWVADSWWGGDYLKVGPITQSKRLAKYNQLLVLDRELGLAWRGVHSSGLPQSRPRFLSSPESSGSREARSRNRVTK